MSEGKEALSYSSSLPHSRSGRPAISTSFLQKTNGHLAKEEKELVGRSVGWEQARKKKDPTFISLTGMRSPALLARSPTRNTKRRSFTLCKQL